MCVRHKKAFDKVNHHGLFVKLMDILLPNGLLSVLEHWYNISVTCVRWGDTFSSFLRLQCGVRQGGVLSPYLFAVYMDQVVSAIQRSGIGCHLKFVCISVFVYADDIILLAPSVDSLQKLLILCEKELAAMEMSLNVKKSVCMRIGPRYDAVCASISTLNGDCLNWVSSCRYIGYYYT